LPTKRDSPREHREIVDATIGRQKELAVALLRLHIEKTAEILAGIKGLWGTTDQP
jgi:DNA-binding GntR family transcriptional regulator